MNGHETAGIKAQPWLGEEHGVVFLLMNEQWNAVPRSQLAIVKERPILDLVEWNVAEAEVRKGGRATLDSADPAQCEMVA